VSRPRQDSNLRTRGSLVVPMLGASGFAPSAGLEPAHTAPEADALSAELRGQRAGVGGYPARLAVDRRGVAAAREGRARSGAALGPGGSSVSLVPWIWTPDGPSGRFGRGVLFFLCASLSPASLQGQYGNRQRRSARRCGRGRPVTTGSPQTRAIHGMHMKIF